MKNLLLYNMIYYYQNKYDFIYPLAELYKQAIAYRFDHFAIRNLRLSVMSISIV